MDQPYSNQQLKRNDFNYKTFGRTDKFCTSAAVVTKTNILEDRINFLSEMKSVKRSLHNFSTHPLIKNGKIERNQNIPKSVCDKIISTTHREFRNYESYLNVERKKEQDSNENQHLNKIQKSEFTSISLTPFKFMDDHFHQLSPEKQRFNSLKRQR